MRTAISILGSILLLTLPAFAQDAPAEGKQPESETRPAPAPDPAPEPAPAPAPEPVENPEAGAPCTHDAHVIGLGLKAGVALPQVSSELGTTFSTHLELSYQFPFLGSRIGLVTSLGYSQPAVSGTGEDARLPDGSYSFEATQQQLLWDFGLVFRLNPHGAFWNLGATIGGRMQAVSTTSNGDAGGESFGEHTETGTFFGLLAGAFGEFTLGPGAAFLAVEYGMASQDLKTVGELNVAAVHILAGYRLMFAL